MEPIDPLALMPRRTLAARWDTSTGHLANLASEGRGPAFIKIGTRVLYRTCDVLDFENASRVRTLEAA